MKPLLLVVALCCATAHAADRCNPFIQKPIRETIICQMVAAQAAHKTADSLWQGFYQTKIEARNKLIDALDAKSITPAQARESLVTLTDLEAKEAAERQQLIADALRSSPAVAPMPLPAAAPAAPAVDVTCRRDIADAFGGVRCQSN